MSTDINNKDNNKSPAKKEDKEKGFINVIWQFFTSMKVAVFFILILAVVSIIGTVVPQQKPPEFYDMIYSQFWVKIVTGLGFSDLYNSFLYKLLLALVGLNITICSAEHFNKHLASGKAPKICLPLKTYKGDRYLNFSMEIKPEEAKEKISGELKKRWFSLKHEKDDEQGGNIHIYGEQGHIKPWGPFILHTGILVIFLGALYGGLTGFKDQAFLLETKDQDIYEEKNEGFQVKLIDFRIEGDEHHSIKDFYSDLEVIDKGEKVLEKTIEVNDPLQYKGVVFYQSSWGMAGLEIKVIPPEGDEEIYSLPLDNNGMISPGDNFFILSNQWIVKIENFYPDASSMGDKITSISGFPFNPLISVQISKDFMEKHMAGGEPSWEDLGWLKAEGAPAEYEGYKFTFNKVIEYSVLQVKKDPGIPVVYLGCFLLMTGMCLAFYLKRRIIRVCLSPEENKTKIYIGFTGKTEEDEKVFLEGIKKKILP